MFSVFPITHDTHRKKRACVPKHCITLLYMTSFSLYKDNISFALAGYEKIKKMIQYHELDDITDDVIESILDNMVIVINFFNE